MNMQTQCINNLNYKSKQFSKIIGHRGARGDVLENTQSGFEYAQNLLTYEQAGHKGIAGIEFDIQLTADGQLVVFHDDSVDRLFGQQGRVEQLLATFFTNNLLSGNSLSHKTLLLQDMPPLLANYCHIELEIKTHNRTNRQRLIDCLAVVLSEFPAGVAINLTSFDVNILERLQYHTYLSQFPRGLLIESIHLPKEKNTESIKQESKLLSCKLSWKQTSQLVDTALRLQCQQVGIMANLISAELIQSCHRYGLSVTAWTVNDITKARWLLDNGVDWVITDYPKEFLRSGFF